MLKDKPVKPSPEMIIKLKKALANKTISQLQHDVYKFLLTEVPLGKVTTYKIIANELKTGARVVGSIVGKNPFAPDVPCHRVVKTSRKLGGYSRTTSNKTVETKMKLLMSEGVKFQPMLPMHQLFSEAMVEKEFVLRN